MSNPDKTPLWFKDAVIYQMHVKTFRDSDGDGIGDFRGLIEKLDYLQALGVTAIWLLPFYPSPLRDDGYDIADYFSVHPNYGTLDDFRELLESAHARGLRIITELVINHTSDQNPWFQRARRAPPGSDLRDFYVWSDTPDKYAEARIIFKDFETSNWTWDHVAKAYYWHRFYSHQPDLNFDNPEVHKAVFSVLDYWLDMGVDGLRLDAVPYLYERENTSCENLPETHALLRKVRAHMDAKYQDRMLLGEANQWPEDAVAYFGEGDECHMCFHFPLMPRLFMSLQMEDRFPVLDILDQTPRIPENCQWATFLRNHDELTLEMVTDEERDYMYKMYATDPRARINLGIRRRLAPLLGNSRRKIEMINMLLLSLPGTPIIYYGDEIGMGDNFYLGDRNGVRTPMQWSADRNAGFSKANPQQLYLPVVIDSEYHYEALNVENQEKNLSSLLWWMRRVITVRRKMQVFGRGSIEFLLPDNPKVLAFVRQYEGEAVLAIFNLSRFAQATELDLSAFAGLHLVEIFSQNVFPIVKDSLYPFTLGPHDRFWFHLQKLETGSASGAAYAAPAYSQPLEWQGLLAGRLRSILEEQILPRYLPACRWFGAKAKSIRTLRVADAIPVSEEPGQARFFLIDLVYFDGSGESYLLPLQIASAEAAREIAAQTPQAIIARFGSGESESVLVDAIYDAAFRAALLRLVQRGSPIAGAYGHVQGFPGSTLDEMTGAPNAILGSQVLKAEQSNSSILYENKLFLKLYRRLEDGINPDSEMIRYLSERQGFKQVPRFAGSIEYRRAGRPIRVLGLFLASVQNEGDAWTYTLDSVGRFFERALAEKPAAVLEAAVSAPLFGPYAPPPTLLEMAGGIYPERARQLARRTGEMHLALAAGIDDADFSPEAFHALNQRSIYQSMRTSVRRTFQLLRRQIPILQEELRQPAAEMADMEEKVLQKLGLLARGKIHATQTRTHGDYHLGQILNTGKDFIIIDFEGEPSRLLADRKLKRSPLRDVAGMIRSFHYAAHTALASAIDLQAGSARLLEPLAEPWAALISRIFLDAYLETVAGASFVPKDAAETEILLEAFLLEKAVYEVYYELNNRPTWLPIPMRGIREILREPAAARG